MIDETLEVIASTDTATLATLCSDGAPYATPITYVFENGRFTWKSSPDAVHSANIAHDSRVSFSIIENVENEVRAVYINACAIATGNTSFDEKWQTSLAEYEIELGEIDKEKSTPGRFYFRGANA